MALVFLRSTAFGWLEDIVSEMNYFYRYPLIVKQTYILKILSVFLFSINTSISDCLIPVNLKEINHTSDLKAHIISDDKVYITAGSNFYKFNQTDPLFSLEKHIYYSVWETTAGLFLKTNQDLYFMGSDKKSELNKGKAEGLPNVNSLKYIYDTNFGTLLIYTDSIYLFDSVKKSNELLHFPKKSINSSCITNEDGFFTALGDKVFRLEKKNGGVRFNPVSGFTGICKHLKYNKKTGLFLMENKSFYKYNPKKKQFEVLTFPGQSPGTLDDFFPLKDQILLTTYSAHYRVSNNGQIEAIAKGNIEYINKAISRQDHMILSSNRGLYIWDGSQEIKEVQNHIEDLEIIGDSDKIVLLQKDKDFFIFKDKALKKVLVDLHPSFNKILKDQNLYVSKIIESDVGSLIATNIGVLLLSNDSKILKHLPGSPKTHVKQLFKTNEKFYVILDNKLYRLHKTEKLKKEIFLDPRKVDSKNNKFRIEFDLDTEKYPCATLGNSWLNFGGMTKDVQGKEDFQPIPFHKKFPWPGSSRFTSEFINYSLDTHIKFGGKTFQDSELVYLPEVLEKAYVANNTRPGSKGVAEAAKEILTNSKGEFNLYNESHALLIGNINYQYWNNLPTVRGELKDVADMLTNQGFQVHTAWDLNSTLLVKTLKEFLHDYGAGESNRNNRLLVFYSGHGDTRKGWMKNKNYGYIIPIDSPQKNQDDNGFLDKALSMDDIVSWSIKVSTKHILFLFDSCFSGSILETKKSGGQVPPHHIHESVKNPVRQFLTAGGANEQVPSQSRFTHTFIRAIKQQAADLTKDGFISGTELYLYFAQEIPKYTNPPNHPQEGKIGNGEDLVGDFIFKIRDEEKQ